MHGRQRSAVVVPEHSFSFSFFLFFSLSACLFSQQVPSYSSSNVREAVEFLSNMVGLKSIRGVSLFEVYEVQMRNGSKVTEGTNARMLHIRTRTCIRKISIYGL